MRGARVIFVEATSLGGGAERAMETLLNAKSFRSGLDLNAAMADSPVSNRLAAAGVVSMEPIDAIALSKIRGAGFLLNSLLAYARTNRQLARIIDRAKPEIIHANSFNAALYCARLARKRGIPLIWHMHDTLRIDRANRALVRYLSDACAVCVAVSQAVSRRLEELGCPGGRLRVIHNGLDTARWNPGLYNRATARAKWQIPETAVVFANIGQIARLKGQVEYLNAARKVPGDEAVFLAVGKSGDSPEELEYLAEVKSLAAQLGARCKLVPWVDDPREVYAVTDVLVHSSTGDDSLPTVILEAMAFGMPVVASCKGGAPEIVVDGETGFIFSPDQPEALVRHMQELAADTDLRSRLGRSGMERLKSHFGLEGQVCKVRALYEEILSGA